MNISLYCFIFFGNVFHLQLIYTQPHNRDKDIMMTRNGMKNGTDSDFHEKMNIKSNEIGIHVTVTCIATFVFIL